MSILVTGAAGFIGSNLVRELRRRFPDRPVVSYDALTYAGNLENLVDVWTDDGHTFIKGDITDSELLEDVFREHDVRAVFHLAAESHVDRSIVGPMAFVKTNVEGTAALLGAASRVWAGRTDAVFVHVSTDEVYGSLGATGAFTETTPYDPRSPYSASKAASDHLARAWFATYDLPVIVTNCTNNYGPFQFPEKLLPVVVTRAIADEPIPVYGEGMNVRDWIHVSDHCAALCAVYEQGTPGQTYCIGGETELSNIDLVERVLIEVDARLGRTAGESLSLIRFVKDRPGHDFRYAMDISKIRSELGWEPVIGLDVGISSTVGWYIDNAEWSERARTGKAKEFERIWYAARVTEATGEKAAANHAAGPGDEMPTVEIDRAEILDRLNASGVLERIGATDQYPVAPTPSDSESVAATPDGSPTVDEAE